MRGHGVKLRSVVTVLSFVAGAALSVASAYAGPISAKGEVLGRFLDSLDVEHKWPAGDHVDWETGLPDGRVVRTPGKHTHCSAFTASAAKQLGVYLLRPPEHSPVLLANAQFDWFGSVAAREGGWSEISDAVAVQQAANDGRLVIAIYRNHRDDKPGHTAIVRPSTKPDEAVVAEGPDVIQAGGTNYNATSLQRGFAGHRAAWGVKREVKFFAHDIVLPAG